MESPEAVAKLHWQTVRVMVSACTDVEWLARLAEIDTRKIIRNAVATRVHTLAKLALPLAKPPEPTVDKRRLDMPITPTDALRILLERSPMSPVALLPKAPARPWVRSPEEVLLSEKRRVVILESGGPSRRTVSWLNGKASVPSSDPSLALGEERMLDPCVVLHPLEDFPRLEAEWDAKVQADNLRAELLAEELAEVRRDLERSKDVPYETLMAFLDSHYYVGSDQKRWHDDRHILPRVADAAM